MPRKALSTVCKYRGIFDQKDLPYPRHGFKYVEIEVNGFIVHRPISKAVRNSKRLPMLIAFASHENPDKKIRLKFDESGLYVVGYRRVPDKPEKKVTALMVV